MNIQKLTKIEKPSKLKDLKLQGIEIVEVRSGLGGTDFQGLKLRDTFTGTLLVIEKGQYGSDLIIYTEEQAKTKQVIRLGGTLDGAGICKDFDKKEDAEIFATEHNLTNIEYLTIQVEVED